jgi:CRISPR/Cas system CMR subunit Cmr6 (Cas7 group RAMP superfamily)
MQQLFYVEVGLALQAKKGMPYIPQAKARGLTASRIKKERMN